MTAPSSHPTIGGHRASTNYLALYIFIFERWGSHDTWKHWALQSGVFD